MGEASGGLAVESGSLVALVGPAGSGKSATARQLADATSGLGGRVGWGSPWPCPPGPGLWHWRTVAASLGIPHAGTADMDLNRVAGVVLDALAAPAPLLLVLEDLHLADRDSMTLLQAVAGALPGLRGAVVATMADDGTAQSLGGSWQLRRLPDTSGSRRGGETSPSNDVHLVSRDGVWEIATGGARLHVRHTKGMSYLAALLAAPARDIHALELAAMGSCTIVGDGFAVSDAAALAAYRQRITELAGEVDDADASNDIGRAAVARAELDQLAAAVSAAVGLGGRARRSGDAAERARLNVTRALRSAIDRIARSDDWLGWHLASCVKTGLFCSYRPEPGRSLRWHLAA